MSEPNGPRGVIVLAHNPEVRPDNDQSQHCCLGKSGRQVFLMRGAMNSPA